VLPILFSILSRSPRGPDAFPRFSYLHLQKFFPSQRAGVVWAPASFFSHQPSPSANALRFLVFSNFMRQAFEKALYLSMPVSRFSGAASEREPLYLQRPMNLPTWDPFAVQIYFAFVDDLPFLFFMAFRTQKTILSPVPASGVLLSPRQGRTSSFPACVFAEFCAVHALHDVRCKCGDPSLRWILLVHPHFSHPSSCFLFLPFAAPPIPFPPLLFTRTPHWTHSLIPSGLFLQPNGPTL